MNNQRNSVTQGRINTSNLIVSSHAGSGLYDGPKETLTPQSELRNSRINAHELENSTDNFNLRFGEELSEMEQTYVRWDNINFYAPAKKVTQDLVQ
jgi:hypothetical protein